MDDCPLKKFARLPVWKFKTVRSKRHLVFRFKGVFKDADGKVRSMRKAAETLAKRAF